MAKLKSPIIIDNKLVVEDVGVNATNGTNIIGFADTYEFANRSEDPEILASVKSSKINYDTLPTTVTKYDTSSPTKLRYTLNNPSPSTNDYFGRYVAISGNYAIVGAYADDTGAPDAGSVYIYNVSTGALVWTFSIPSPAANDQFGYSVGISGNYAIVGAPGDDPGATDSGAAYIYNISTGALVQTLNNPSPVEYDFFGFSVAISGNYAIVGTYNDDIGAADAGSAYIYNVSTGALVHTLNNPSPATADWFGYSVAISGNYAIVGALYDDTGATDAGSAYIYNVSTGALVWTLNNPTPVASDSFGNSVAISGNYAIVGAHQDSTGASGAGSAYIYNVSTGALVWTLNNPSPVASDYFGRSVAISGNYVIVGAYLDDTGATDAGSAYIYNVSTGALVWTLNNPSPVASDFFGMSVAISGNYAIVGAYADDTNASNSGSAYIYELGVDKLTALVHTNNYPKNVAAAVVCVPANTSYSTFDSTMFNFTGKSNSTLNGSKGIFINKGYNYFSGALNTAYTVAESVKIPIKNATFDFSAYHYAATGDRADCTVKFYDENNVYLGKLVYAKTVSSWSRTSNDTTINFYDSIGTLKTVVPSLELSGTSYGNGAMKVTIDLTDDYAVQLFPRYAGYSSTPGTFSTRKNYVINGGGVFYKTAYITLTVDKLYSTYSTGSCYCAVGEQFSLFNPLTGSYAPNVSYVS